MGAKRIYVIAGEPSGDRLGGLLLQALAASPVPPAAIEGIGGPRMQSSGLSSYFPMEEIALMGFAEILPHIPRLLKRIRETVLAIEVFQPDVLVTIDSPGFNFRVVKELRKRGTIKPRFVHYVAPTVWAYKPERAAKTAKLFDELLVLFPFEPPYFERQGLKTTFVGHPVMEETPPLPHPKAGHLLMLPGSRKGELDRHLPVYRETLSTLLKDHPSLSVTLPVPRQWESYVREATNDWPLKVTVTGEEAEKRRAIESASAALVKSGTITLEMARAGVPMITTYKVNPISAAMIKRMIKTPYVNLVNILLGRQAVPELLQKDATPSRLAVELSALLEDGAARVKQQAAFREVELLLSPEGNEKPSQIAAKAILS